MLWDLQLEQELFENLIVISRCLSDYIAILEVLESLENLQ